MTGPETVESISFEDFYLLHHRRLVGALSVAVGFSAAEDAVQEAFIEANVRWSRVSRTREPVAWVRRVAINRLIDGGRRRARHTRALARLDSPGDAVDRHHDHELAQAVAALPDRQRLAVALYYLLDLPVVEVAELLGVSEGTIKSNLHDARSALRLQLQVVDDG